MKISFDIRFSDLPSGKQFDKVFGQQIEIDNPLINIAYDKSGFILDEVEFYLKQGFIQVLKDVPWN